MTVFCSFVEALDSVYYDQHKGRVGRTVFCSFVEAQDSVYYDQQKGREGKGREGKGREGKGREGISHIFVWGGESRKACWITS